MMNEHGVSLSRNTGMQTKQVQVIKCKACGEILSQEHNYHLTPEELARLEAQSRKKEDKILWVLFVITVLLALCFLSYTISFAIKGEFFGPFLILTLICVGMAWWSSPSKFR